MKLNLFQNMCYSEAKLNSSLLIDEYEKAMNELITLPTSYEAVLLCSFETGDSFDFIVNKKGTALPPDKKIKDKVDNLQPVGKSETADFFIKAGKYNFTQFPSSPSQDRLLITVVNAVNFNEGSFALRMLKESAFEIKVQIIQADKGNPIFVGKEL